MSGGLEAAHGSFALARRLVRMFHPVVAAVVFAVLDPPPYFVLGCCVAAQFVGDQHARHLGASVQAFPDELDGSCRVASALHEDSEDHAVLIDGPPQVGCRPVYVQEAFVHMRCSAGLCSSTAQLVRVGLADFPRPLADGFVGHDDPAFGQQLLDVPVAEGAAMVQPHGRAHNFSREAKTVV